MNIYAGVGIVTLLSAMMCFMMAGVVSRARIRSGLGAPTMAGDPATERKIRAHLNTVEWMPIFLPSLWLFALYCSAALAVAIGAVWIAGRVAYFVGYSLSPQKRYLGFGIQAIAASVLMFGALAKLIWLALFVGPAI
ncbi:MAG: MAPEG family protein [Mesorhizobium sp.]|uniref:MAPEG family protein n=1 Tax=Mesorhizobium sp. TaxID=1871066 RepID=UPI0011FFFA94|nr:MAPEG family protein [Mesorhizobium sp.]TIR15850.1 MAG: MAPEG family protein [Mesorhizobium sp.]